MSEPNRVDNEIRLLPEQQTEVLDNLAESDLMRGILGGPAVDAITAVRRYEQQNYGHLPPEELADTFRMAWSV